MLKSARILCPILLIFGLYTSAVQGVLKREDTLLRQDVVARLETLREFVPQKHYKWHIRWVCNGTRQYGTLEGLQQGPAHWITIKFSSGRKLIFDKTHPCVALYPNAFCLCKSEAFTSPLQDLLGVCIHMIAMPFLNWNIVSYSKTAKLGRRAIRVVLAKDHLRCEVFLDKNFNTILQAKMWDTQSNFTASFTLKRLKKFKTGWGLQSTEFTLNSRKTLLYVDAVEGLD